MDAKFNIVEMTAEIVSAYVGKNPVQADGLPNLIRTVHGALLSAVHSDGATLAEALKPAVPVKKSVTSDFIICLEDGKKFRSLKRHLWTHYNLTPDQYREKWGLPHDYPMVAPSYAQARSRLAKQMGLGNRDRSPRRRRSGPRAGE